MSLFIFILCTIRRHRRGRRSRKGTKDEKKKRQTMTTRRVSFGCVMYFCISPYAFLYISIRIFVYLHTHFCTCSYISNMHKKTTTQKRKTKKKSNQRRKKKRQTKTMRRVSFRCVMYFFYIHFCVSPYLTYYAQEDDDSDEGSGEQHEQDSDQREDNEEGNFWMCSNVFLHTYIIFAYILTHFRIA